MVLGFKLWVLVLPTLAPTFTSCVTLDKPHNHSLTQFPHVQNGNHNRVFLLEFHEAEIR